MRAAGPTGGLAPALRLRSRTVTNAKKGPQGISLLGSRSSHQAPNANRQARAPLRGPAAAIRARPAPPPFAIGTGPSGGPAARCARSRRPEGRAARRRQSPCAVRGPKTQKGPQGEIPCGLSRRIEKRPPRARRPALPQPCAAVLSAKAGLTAGFGMGPGDPRLCGRARGGRSPAAPLYGACQEPLAGATLAAAWRAREKITHRARCLSSRMRRARAISAARLSASPRLHLRPIDQVVYLGPYQRVDSSRRRLPA